MRSIQAPLAVLCISLTATAAFAQDRIPRIEGPETGFSGIRKYYPPTVAPIDIENSTRIQALLRGGNLYLSLQDAVSLALENNLDIGITRFSPLQAQQDLLRTQAGSAPRGIAQNILVGPNSAANANVLSTLGTATTNPASTGPLPPSFDPALIGTLSYGHSSSPQVNSVLTAQTVVLGSATTSNFGIQDGFPTGATASLTFNNSFNYQNTSRLGVNPYTNGSLGLLVTQPLLQGFGFAFNRRLIVQARNSLRAEDAVFKLQVQTTVASVVNLYWDLVSYNENVKVAQQALASAEKLYNDNKKQVEIGTLAPIAIVQAEAQVATDQQNLTTAQTQVLQQETILKNAVLRNGISDPAIAEARIVTLDRIRVPDVEPVQPIQDLLAMALDNRPELNVSNLNIENSKINIKADRNSLLPNVSAFVNLTNSALVGDPNTLSPTSSVNVTNPLLSTTPTVFTGGYGSYLSQIFFHNFPNYTVGVNLTIPVRNRQAQSDYVRDTLALRQNQLTLQKQVNQIRVDVQNALIALQQARAQYQAAVKGRILEEQTLDAEQKKYALGASTIYNVILIQRDLATAQGAEVVAESNYIKARNNLNYVTGQVLEANNVDLSDAVKGTVSKPPSPIPATTDQNNGSAALAPGVPLATPPKSN